MHRLDRRHPWLRQKAARTSRQASGCPCAAGGPAKCRALQTPRKAEEPRTREPMQKQGGVCLSSVLCSAERRKSALKGHVPRRLGTARCYLNVRLEAFCRKLAAPCGQQL